MSTPILATKLYIPVPRPNVILRPRLIERLNESLQRKLSLISAPAGFGKTTLISEWIADCQRPVAWLSLDEGDEDLIRFLVYLVAALQTIPMADNELQIGEGVLKMIESPQPPPTESILTVLLNEISAFPDNFILVLDDYHVLDAKPVDQALVFLIEHLPPQMHLVITTREDPPLPLARYRARSQMTELRAADLRFVPSEAAGFLNQAMGLDLSAQEIAALEARTEGWIAGLQLAALSLQGRADTATFIQDFTGSHHFILDYLVEEVLQQQPQDVRNFLLQTSILNELTGSLCNAITDREDGTPMLEMLERSNLFVVPLDNTRHWYRYHHLFADVLKARALAEDAGQVADGHRRASQWYEQNKQTDNAIRHALAGSDFERAADLVELIWPTLHRSSLRSAALLSWLRALPDELVRARPVLSTGYAWELLNNGELEAAEARLQDAEGWLNEAADTIVAASEQPEALPTAMIVIDPEEFRTLPAEIASARSYLALALGDVPGAVTHARRALDLLPQDAYIRRGPAAALLGLAYWAGGDLEPAHQALADAMESFRMAGNIVFAISGTYGLADIRKQQGRLNAAVRTYEQALQLSMAQGEPAIQGTADLYLGLAELHNERGDPGGAQEALRRSERLGEQAALPDWPYRLYRAKARLQETRGELNDALDLLDTAARLYVRSPVPDVRPIAALKTKIWIAQGKLTPALEWVRERDLSVDDDLSYLSEFEQITLARVLLAQCQYARPKNAMADGAQYQSDGEEDSMHAVLRLLDRLLASAEAKGRLGNAIEILLLQARAHEAQDDTPSALKALERALVLAEPEGYIHIFVDEGLPLAQLLTRASAHGIMPDYTRKLLAAFDADAETEAKHSNLPVAQPLSPLQPLVEPLSQRELEVLQLVAQGLSNREISEQLFVALSTVKGHNRIIFGKLQVQRRTEAVARARELGLL